MQLYLATVGFQRELLKLNVQLQLVSERKSEHAKHLLQDRNQAIEIGLFFFQTIQDRQDYVSCGVCGFGISGGGRVPSVRPRFWHFNEGSNEVFHAAKFLEAS